MRVRASSDSRICKRVYQGGEYSPPGADVARLKPELPVLACLQDLEAIRPKTILRLIESAENLRLSADSNSPPSPSEHVCQNCGYLTSQVGTCVRVAIPYERSIVWRNVPFSSGHVQQKICKACVLLEGLNTGNPHAGLRKTANK